MKAFFVFLITIVAFQPTRAQLPPARAINKKLSLAFNRNIEFLGFAYFIGFEGTNSDTLLMDVEGKKMLEKDWQNYGWHFYQQYKSFANSKHLETALTIAGELWLSDIIPLLLQVEDFPRASLPPHLPETVFLAFSPNRDPKAAKERAIRFLDACNALYTEVNFNQYLSASAARYRAALLQIKTSLPDPAFIASLESFYRKKMDSYQLIPSLTLPKGMAFGPRYNSGGLTKVYNVFGAYGFQSFLHTAQPDMGFSNKDKLRELSIHEFGHSFVNPVLSQLPDSLIRSLDALFRPLKTAMEAQGYTTWKTCLTEHFVRAGEVVIAEKMGNPQSARQLEAEYITKRKFVYLPLIMEQLRAYDRNPGDDYRQVVDRVLKKLGNHL